MSARSGLLRGQPLRMRNVRPSSRALVAFWSPHNHLQQIPQNQRQQQQRLINHFTAKVPETRIQAELARLKQNNVCEPFTLAVKDNIATTTPPSLPTTCASPFLKTYKSPIEATIVSQLRSRGGVIVGKTNLDEFGMGSYSTHSVFGAVAQWPPETTEPSKRNSACYDVNEVLSAGGSSGGSAVAVAEGDAEIALGTDTGGSVRLPAAYTGVVGFKPSYGMLSRYGVVPYANSLDTVGLLARSVGQITRLIIGRGGEGSGNGGLWKEHDPKDPTSLSTAARKRCAAQREGYHNGVTKKSAEKPLSGMKFGIPLEYNIQELDPRIRDVWASMAKKLQDLGAQVVPVSLPSTRHALSAYYIIAPAEASSNLAKYDGVRYGRNNFEEEEQSETNKQKKNGDDVLYTAVRGAGFGPEVKRRILLGSYTLSSEAIDNYFIQAQKVRRLVRRDFDRAFRLSNPLLGDDESQTTYDLSDLPESIPMENKFGPTQVDFLLCPTAPTVAPLLADVMGQHEAPEEESFGEEGNEAGSNNNGAKKVIDAYMNDVFTVPASLAGLPAVSIPVTVEDSAGASGSSPIKRHAGLQLIGQYWDDARLLDVAEVITGAEGK